MPELPEVETIRRQLSEKLVGQTIESIEIRENRSFSGDPAALSGHSITRFGRIGKYLFIYFDMQTGIVGHLKMTGRLILGDTTSPYEAMKHTRVIFRFANGTHLFFWDTRKFGYLRIVGDVRREEEKAKKTMGPDPWEATGKYLLGKLKKSKRPIKEILLDQTILSGVGNIYANDGLWLARISPLRTAQSLKRGEVARLIRAIRTVMERGLATGGASDNTYVDALGRQGTYQNEYRVYRRAGQPCKRDGTRIERIVIGGRGTWYCPACQK